MFISNTHLRCPVELDVERFLASAPGTTLAIEELRVSAKTGGSANAWYPWFEPQVVDGAHLDFA